MKRPYQHLYFSFGKLSYSTYDAMLDRLFTLIDQERYDDALALENEFKEFPDDESVYVFQVVKLICAAML